MARAYPSCGRVTPGQNAIQHRENKLHTKRTQLASWFKLLTLWLWGNSVNHCTISLYTIWNYILATYLKRFLKKTLQNIVACLVASFFHSRQKYVCQSIRLSDVQIPVPNITQHPFTINSATKQQRWNQTL